LAARAAKVSALAWASRSSAKAMTWFRVSVSAAKTVEAYGVKRLRQQQTLAVAFREYIYE
jgi:hypothetical protein